jgi:hypothetical protein
MPHLGPLCPLRLLLQNGGRLSHAKRGQFAELTGDEIGQIEQGVSAVLRA